MVNDHPASLGVTYSQHVQSPGFVGFLDKSVANTIPYDVGLAPTPYTGQNASPTGNEPAPYLVVCVQSSAA